MESAEDNEVKFSIGEAVYAYQNRGSAYLYEAKVCFKCIWIHYESFISYKV